MKKIELSKLKAAYFSLTDRQKNLLTFTFTVVVVCICVIIILAASAYKSCVHLEVFKSDKITSLTALNSNARAGEIKKSDYAFFKFSKDQQETFAKVFKENSTCALTVRLELKPTKKQAEFLGESDSALFKFGFLDSSDFTKKGKFIKNDYFDNKRIIVQGKENQAPKIFDLSFAIPKNENIETVIPQGFFIYSDVRCKILAACIVPSEVGFDMTGQIPFYGFACNGGLVDFTNSIFDFSGSSMVFPVQNSSSMTMPEFLLTFYDDIEMKSTVEKSVRAEINFGGEKLYVKNVKAARQVIIPSAALKTPFSRMELLSNKECLSSVILRSTNRSGTEVLEPVKTDPGLILDYKQNYWRTLDYELFEWDRYPGILFFDFRNYDVQDKFLKRMAFFVEKAGYKGKLWANEDLQDKHGYNAHDYRSQSMADFFNEATKTGFKLNPEEELLRKILLHNGLLLEDGEYVKAGNGAVVSISKESRPGLRYSLLAHEGWHTIYFRDEEFRNYVSAVYYTMDPTSKDFLIDYFKSQPSLGYDTNDQYLMYNEFMAYILQQGLSDVAAYFVHHANRGSVIKFTPQLAAYVRNTQGKGFEDAAFALNDFVFDKYGVVSGSIALVSR